MMEKRYWMMGMTANLVESWYFALPYYKRVEWTKFAKIPRFRIFATSLVANDDASSVSHSPGIVALQQRRARRYVGDSP